jgi:hypothetical protein
VALPFIDRTIPETVKLTLYAKRDASASYDA